MTSGSFTSNTPQKDRSGDYQWDISEAKSRRKAYLFVFLLMVVVPAVIAAAASFVVAYIVSIAFGILFMILFLGLAKQVLHYSAATIIVLLIVICFIPVASLLAVFIIDYKLFNAIKKREKILKQSKN